LGTTNNRRYTMYKKCKNCNLEVKLQATVATEFYKLTCPVCKFKSYYRQEANNKLIEYIVNKGKDKKQPKSRAKKPSRWGRPTTGDIA